MRYRGWMSAEESDIEERILMTRIKYIFLLRMNLEYKEYG
jgi:hypothetical protein